MAAKTDFDLLILGGGCAGLSLAMRLAASNYRGRVGILEPRRDYRDDRSWCFWAPEHHSLSELVSQRWQRWQCSRLNQTTHDRAARGFSYQYVNSLDFYKTALSAIAANPRMTLLRGESAKGLESHKGLVQVHTSGLALSARQVVDTRPPPRSQLADSMLHQCFAGRVVRLREDSPGRFDPTSVELMTDLQNDRHGLCFSYVLPFSAHHALVEITRFSSAPVARHRLDAELDRLMRRRGWDIAGVERSEGGILPMGLPPATTSVPNGVVRAGTGGGALRAASGYGFLRIQQWAQRCSDSLARGGPAIAQGKDSARQDFMDRLFLQVLKDHPEQAPELFERMISRVPGPSFVRFMSDQAGWMDLLRVVSSLPLGPFLGSLVRSTGRRFVRFAAP
ncbi:MAG: lycopene cyclase family protein [Wenzhouxiangella sp.]